MAQKTIRLTMAQAVVRYLCNQYTIVDGERVPLFAGLFGIFGHGNVTCLSEALEQVQDQLPTYRGQNEQSMALAAIGFAKATLRSEKKPNCSSISRLKRPILVVRQPDINQHFLMQAIHF